MPVTHYPDIYLIIVPRPISTDDSLTFDVIAMAQGKETKHFRAFCDSKLKPGESILGHLDGWIGEMMGKGDKTQRNGQFVLTDQRACFYRKGMLGEVFETIPIAKITSVETLSRMGYRAIRLHTSHDELAFKTFEAKNYFDAVYDAIEGVRDGGVQPSAEPAVLAHAVVADAPRDEIDCPNCAEPILAKAKVCKHCKLPVNQIPEAQIAAPKDRSPAPPDCPPVFTVTCKCGTKMKAKSKLLGKTVKCLKCNHPVTVVPDA